MVWFVGSSLVKTKMHLGTKGKWSTDTGKGCSGKKWIRFKFPKANILKLSKSLQELVQYFSVIVFTFKRGNICYAMRCDSFRIWDYIYVCTFKTKCLETYIHTHTRTHTCIHNTLGYFQTSTFVNSTPGNILICMSFPTWTNICEYIKLPILTFLI